MLCLPCGVAHGSVTEMESWPRSRRCLPVSLSIQSSPELLGRMSPIVANACSLAIPSVARSPRPSVAPADGTRPPCACKVAPPCLPRSLSGAADGLVLPPANHEGGGTAQRGEGISS